jgi:hypothetical protein
MATVDQLCKQGHLVQIDGGLAAHEEPLRLLYALPHVAAWLEKILPTIDPDLHPGRLTPLDQLDDLIHDYVVGADMAYYARSHSMEPHEHGVWEFKSEDIRLFGWFIKRDIFVIADVDTAYRCKMHDLYPGYRDQVRKRRDDLDLDEPKHIVGGYNYVF